VAGPPILTGTLFANPETGQVFRSTRIRIYQNRSTEPVVGWRDPERTQPVTQFVTNQHGYAEIYIRGVVRFRAETGSGQALYTWDDVSAGQRTPFQDPSAADPVVSDSGASLDQIDALGADAVDLTAGWSVLGSGTLGGDLFAHSPFSVSFGGSCRLTWTSPDLAPGYWEVGSRIVMAPGGWTGPDGAVYPERAYVRQGSARRHPSTSGNLDQFFEFGAEDLDFFAQSPGVSATPPRASYPENTPFQVEVQVSYFAAIGDAQRSNRPLEGGHSMRLIPDQLRVHLYQANPRVGQIESLTRSLASVTSQVEEARGILQRIRAEAPEEFTGLVGTPAGWGTEGQIFRSTGSAGEWSNERFTAALETKLAGIADNADVSPTGTALRDAIDSAVGNADWREAGGGGLDEVHTGTGISGAGTSANPIVLDLTRTASDTQAGLMGSADKSKLDGIDAGARARNPDSVVNLRILGRTITARQEDGSDIDITLPRFVTGGSFDNTTRQLTLTFVEGNPLVITIPGGGSGGGGSVDAPTIASLLGGVITGATASTEIADDDSFLKATADGALEKIAGEDMKADIEGEDAWAQQFSIIQVFNGEDAHNLTRGGSTEENFNVDFAADARQDESDLGLNHSTGRTAFADISSSVRTQVRATGLLPYFVSGTPNCVVTVTHVEYNALNQVVGDPVVLYRRAIPASSGRTAYDLPIGDVPIGIIGGNTYEVNISILPVGASFGASVSHGIRSGADTSHLIAYRRFTEDEGVTAEALAEAISSAPQALAGGGELFPFTRSSDGVFRVTPLRNITATILSAVREITNVIRQVTTGGTSGQILTRDSSNGYGWADAPTELPANPSNDELLAYVNDTLGWVGFDMVRDFTHVNDLATLPIRLQQIAWLDRIWQHHGPGPYVSATNTAVRNEAEITVAASQIASNVWGANNDPAGPLGSIAADAEAFTGKVVWDVQTGGASGPHYISASIPEMVAEPTTGAGYSSIRLTFEHATLGTQSANFNRNRDGAASEFDFGGVRFRQYQQAGAIPAALRNLLLAVETNADKNLKIRYEVSSGTPLNFKPEFIWRALYSQVNLKDTIEEDEYDDRILQAARIFRDYGEIPRYASVAAAEADGVLTRDGVVAFVTQDRANRRETQRFYIVRKGYPGTGGTRGAVSGRNRFSVELLPMGDGNGFFYTVNVRSRIRQVDNVNDTSRVDPDNRIGWLSFYDGPGFPYADIGIDPALTTAHTITIQVHNVLNARGTAAQETLVFTRVAGATGNFGGKTYNTYRSTLDAAQQARLHNREWEFLRETVTIDLLVSAGGAGIDFNPDEVQFTRGAGFIAPGEVVASEAVELMTGGGGGGQPGDPGRDGRGYELAFIRSNTQPTISGSGPNVPQNYHRTPPVGSEPLWMAVARFDGTNWGTWSTPRRISGDTGAAANRPVFIYTLSATVPERPTFATLAAVGTDQTWSQAPRAAVAPNQLYASEALITPAGALAPSSAWSAPVPFSGPQGAAGLTPVNLYRLGATRPARPTFQTLSAAASDPNWNTQRPSPTTSQDVWASTGWLSGDENFAINDDVAGTGNRFTLPEVATPRELSLSSEALSDNLRPEDQRNRTLADVTDLSTTGGFSDLGVRLEDGGLYIFDWVLRQRVGRPAANYAGARSQQTLRFTAAADVQEVGTVLTFPVGTDGTADDGLPMQIALHQPASGNTRIAYRNVPWANALIGQNVFLNLDGVYAIQASQGPEGPASQVPGPAGPPGNPSYSASNGLHSDFVEGGTREVEIGAAAGAFGAAEDIFDFTAPADAEGDLSLDLHAPLYLKNAPIGSTITAVLDWRTTTTTDDGTETTRRGGDHFTFLVTTALDRAVHMDTSVILRGIAEGDRVRASLRASCSAASTNAVVVPIAAIGQADIAVRKAQFAAEGGVDILRWGGEKGDAGADGAGAVDVFIRSSTSPATPTGTGPDAPSGGWALLPPTGTLPLWVSRSLLRNGSYAAWSAPARISGQDGVGAQAVAVSANQLADFTLTGTSAAWGSWVTLGTFTGRSGPQVFDLHLEGAVTDAANTARQMIDLRVVRTTTPALAPPTNIRNSREYSRPYNATLASTVLVDEQVYWENALPADTFEVQARLFGWGGGTTTFTATSGRNWCSIYPLSGVKGDKGDPGDAATVDGTLNAVRRNVTDAAGTTRAAAQTFTNASQSVTAPWRQTDLEEAFDHAVDGVGNRDGSESNYEVAVTYEVSGAANVTGHFTSWFTARDQANTIFITDSERVAVPVTNGRHVVRYGLAIGSRRFLQANLALGTINFASGGTVTIRAVNVSIGLRTVRDVTLAGNTLTKRFTTGENENINLPQGSFIVVAGTGSGIADGGNTQTSFTTGRTLGANQILWCLASFTYLGTAYSAVMTGTRQTIASSTGISTSAVLGYAFHGTFRGVNQTGGVTDAIQIGLLVADGGLARAYGLPGNATLAFGSINRASI